MNNKAFTLVEFSIVIMIISILLGLVLNFGAQKTDADKLKENRMKIAEIESAINSYFIENQSIPCPADPTLGISSNSFGISAAVVAPNNTCNSSMGRTNLHSGSMIWGMVPARTLNISDDLTIDAYGRRFSYIMVQQCNCNSTAGGACATSNFNTNDCGINNGINILSASGSSIASRAILVVMSHGRAGHGAFNSSGSTIRIKSGATIISTDELENAHFSAAGVEQAANNNFVAKTAILSSTPSAYFDDYVMFWTKEKIVSNAKLFQNNYDDICNIISSFSASQTCGTKTTANCSTVFNNLINSIKCFN